MMDNDKAALDVKEEKRKAKEAKKAAKKAAKSADVEMAAPSDAHPKKSRSRLHAHSRVPCPRVRRALGHSLPSLLPLTMPSGVSRSVRGTIYKHLESSDEEDDLEVSGNPLKRPRNSSSVTIKGVERMNTHRAKKAKQKEEALSNLPHNQAAALRDLNAHPSNNDDQAVIVDGFDSAQHNNTNNSRRSLM
ncbi:hypothetical protein NMY22_g18038 [Coprinellus aureogranulatus]|nr:hypothetical protein NMY22_g18038 [Coprinellus aureogranulatus]